MVRMVKHNKPRYLKPALTVMLTKVRARAHSEPLKDVDGFAK